MSRKPSKPIIGIIGGIGAGKSIVAQQFAQLGCRIVDADALAHDILTEKEVQKQIIARWGQDLQNGPHEIDRALLAARVFTDPRELMALNALIHPKVLDKAERLIRHYQSDPAVPAIVLDMPLLLEVGWDKRCHRIIFVKCDAQTRKKHFQQKCNTKAVDIDNREKNQISLDRKESRADNTINNNSDFAELFKQVNEIFTDIIK